MAVKKIRKDKFSFLNFLGLTLAGIVNAIGAILFLYPLKIYDSGISGLSMLLDQVTPSWLTVSIFLIIFNVPIFLFGLKKQGIVFTVYAIYSVAIYSLVAFLFQKVIFDLSTGESPIAGSELILCAVFGGIVSGIGSGLAIKFGGGMDGIDILSVIFSKKLGLSIGNFILIFNVLLYIAAGIVLQSWVLPLYSIIAYFCGSKTIDYITEGFSRSITAAIITNKADKVSKALSDSFGQSGTIVNAIGGYTKTKKHIIYFNVNHFQINKLKEVVHTADPTSYITLQDVSDIIKAHK